MKDVKQIAKSKLLPAIVWVILGSVMVLQQVSATPAVMFSIESSANDNADEKQEAEIVAVSQAAINSVVGVHLTQALHQIMEIKFEFKNDPEPEDEVTLFEAGHLRTLFRQVISPNAP
jgi:flagellar basal body-associated protein FliL